MDMKKTGQFLAQLRKESGLTQEELGEKLGVTNKTVSRWENGNYLPPVEMLQALSGLYGLTINELLSGKRLEETDYKEQAEENIKAALRTSSFTVNEQLDFFKRKWKKDHLFSTVLSAVVWGGAYIYAWAISREDWAFIVAVAGIAYHIIRRNVMMAYAEEKVFDGPDVEKFDAQKGKRVLLKRLRIGAMLILALLIWVTVDLGCNYFASLPVEMNDGLTVRGIFSPLIFGDAFWSREWFFDAFAWSLTATGAAAILNLVLACVEKLKK